MVRIHATPDGININENCGSTHMDSLRAAVVAERADLGIALDGDADRCLAVDATGRIVDGDQILAILALAMREAGRLKDDTVVATVMSNLGFVQAMQRPGSRSSRRGWATGTCWRRCGPGGSPSAVSSPATWCCRARHHR